MKTQSIGAAILAVAASFGGPVCAAPFTNLYVLGDSLSDQGNLFAATALPPPTGFGQGVPRSDFYFQGRFSNGDVYTDLLAERFRVPLGPSFFGGNNFAYGGARADYNTVQDPKPFPGLPMGSLPPDSFPWSLNLQRQAFVDRGIFDPGAIFVAFAGSNDVGDMVSLTIGAAMAGGGFDLEAGLAATAPINAAAVAAMRQTLLAFADAGAETVLVPNIPDLGLVPRVFQNGAFVADLASQLTVRYNDALDAMLNQLADQLPDIRLVRFDTFRLFQKVLPNPGAFGFTNATEGCYSGFVDPSDDPSGLTVCPNPDEYIFWDGLHPTTAFHDLLARRFAGAAIPEPSSLLLLAGGVLGIAARRRHRARDGG